MFNIPKIKFSASIWQWRGPAPFYFVTVPDEESKEIKEISKMVTYGWGMIPVTAQIGGTKWKTSMFEKDGNYVVPIKSDVRKRENVAEGDLVILNLSVN